MGITGSMRERIVDADQDGTVGVVDAYYEVTDQVTPVGFFIELRYGDDHLTLDLDRKGLRKLKAFTEQALGVLGDTTNDNE